MRGLFGSMITSTPPVESFTNSTFSHDLPPSCERKMPRSGCGPYAVPSAATYTRSGLVGCTTMRAMRPVLSRPDRAHVLPASVDLYSPQPIEMCERMNGAPVPTHTTFGSLG